MIIWLASYPKSGNTWVRSLIVSLLYSENGIFNFKNLEKISQFPQTSHLMSIGVDVNNEKEVFKNFINAQNFINKERQKVKFFKTHSSLCKMYDSNFTDLKNTLGSIYIVRDPRNVVTSLAHHYDLSVDQATNVMIDKDRLMDKTAKNCRVFLGSWGFNYNSWKNLQNQKKYLLVKYEDLLNKKKTILLKIFKYLDSLGLKSSLDMIKLNKVIKTTEFESMKKKEENETFYEAVIDNSTGKRKNFFNLGPQNNWRKLLDKKNVDKIEISFEKEMLELGYL